MADSDEMEKLTRRSARRDAAACTLACLAVALLAAFFVAYAIGALAPDGSHAHAAAQVFSTPRPAPATQASATPRPGGATQVFSTPRPAATPVQQAVAKTPAPEQTADPMLSQLVRDELAKSLASDIEPTPNVPSRNVKLTPAQAAKQAVEALKPSIRTLELQRTRASRQASSLQQSISLARTALEYDDRYHVLLEEEEKYGLDPLDPDTDMAMFMELAMYKAAGYEELNSDTRRQLVLVRDQGADTLNQNIKKINDSIETAKRGTEYSAYAQYANIAKLQAAIAISQESLDIQAAEHEKTKKKYEMGLVSRMDLESAEISYKKNVLSHSKTKRTCQALVMSFNSLLGQNLATTYEDFDAAALAPSSRVRALSYYLDSALAKRSEILQLKESLRLADHQVELFEDEPPYKLSSLDDKRDAEQSAEETRIDYDNALMDVEYEIRAAYKESQALRGNLQYCEEQVTAAEQNLERVEKLFELGTALQSSVETVRMSLTQARIQLSNAKIDIWLQEQKLATISGIGPGGL